MGTCVPCFSPEATVMVERKGPVAMKDLSQGDYVLTSNNKYEPVYAFGHRHTEKTTEFVQIETTTNGKPNPNPLEMTGQHLVFLQGKSNPVRADSIKVGDILQGEGGVPAVVTHLDTVTRDGLYGPLTVGGTIVVDGIVASSYTSNQDKEDDPEYPKLNGGSTLPVSHHLGMHLFYSPLRLMCLGVSPELCVNANTRSDGMHWFASLGAVVASWIEEQSLLVQILLFVLIPPMFVACYVLESLVGAQFAPLVLAVAIAAYTHFSSKDKTARLCDKAAPRKTKLA